MDDFTNDDEGCHPRYWRILNGRAKFFPTVHRSALSPSPLRKFGHEIRPRRGRGQLNACQGMGVVSALVCITCEWIGGPFFRQHPRTSLILVGQEPPPPHIDVIRFEQERPKSKPPLFSSTICFNGGEGSMLSKNTTTCHPPHTKFSNALLVPYEGLTRPRRYEPEAEGIRLG